MAPLGPIEFFTKYELNLGTTMLLFLLRLSEVLAFFAKCDNAAGASPFTTHHVYSPKRKDVVKFGKI